MFSKKKKGDAAPGASEAPAPETASAPPPDASADISAEPAEGSSGGGLAGGGLSGGLGGGAKSAKPNIAASRLGGRPAARPSAPSTPMPGAPTAAQEKAAADKAAASAAEKAAAEEAEARAQAKIAATAKVMPSDIVGGVASDDKTEGKNPYKLNPLFDIVLPVGMSVVLCGGFASGIKLVKDKHDIYGFTKEEQETVVKDKSIAAEGIIAEINKLEPMKLLNDGETAQALTAAKQMGLDSLKLAGQGGENDATKAVRGLCASGIVLSRAGSKAEKELGLSYLARAEEIATYSKYVRIIYARELARNRHVEEAVAQYTKIISLFPESWTAPHKELGMLYMKTNDGQKAVDELTALMKADPKDPSIARQLGLAMAQAGDQEAGFAEFQKGFQREQDALNCPAAVKPLVDAHNGFVQATYDDIKKQADKHPDDLKLQLDLARLEIATNKFKDARDRMDRARKTHELDPEVHEIMAEVMVRQSQSTSAFDEFRSAAQNLHLQN